MTVLPSGPGSVTSFSVSVKASPVAGLSMSTAQASVPDGPVCGSSRLNIASITGVARLAAERAAAPSCSQRQRITAAVAATTPGNRRCSPCGGNGISKARSSATVASASSLSCSQAGSLARRSIDSVLASAPRPRGCSAPLTQTSKGCGGAAALAARSSPTKSAKLAERVVDHEGPGRVAAGQLGPARPAQRGQHRRRQALEREAAVGMSSSCSGAAARRRDAQHRAEHRVRPVGGQALQARLPGLAGRGPGSPRTGSRPAR